MKMKRYPSFMVPHIGLNKMVEVDSLLKYGDFAVARRVDRHFCPKDIKILSDGSGIVKQDSSLLSDFFERIPYMSMTMLRQEFPISSAKFDLKMRKYIDDWNGKLVKPWTYRKKAIIVEDCFLMVYKAKSLHGKPSKHQARFDNKIEAQNLQDYYEGLKDDIVTNNFERKKIYKGSGRIFLRHSPTALNYWHYELELEKSEGGAVKSVKYKPKEDAAQMNLKPSFVNYVWETYLCKHFWVDLNPCEKDIPMTCFIDKGVSHFNKRMAVRLNKCLFSAVPIAILQYSLK